MNAEQVFELLRKAYLESYLKYDDELTLDQVNSDSDDFWYEAESIDTTVDGVSIKAVECWGGEGQGDSAGFVLLVGTQYFRKTAFYTSYDGTYWDEGEDLHEVEPYEVTVTKYRKVK